MNLINIFESREYIFLLNSSMYSLPDRGGIHSEIKKQNHNKFQIRIENKKYFMVWCIFQICFEIGNSILCLDVNAFMITL